MTVMFLLVGCIPVTPELTPGSTRLSTSTSEVYPAPYPVSTSLFPALPPTEEVYPQPVTGETTQVGEYPLPISTQQAPGSIYPGPESTQATVHTQITPLYPGPELPGGVTGLQPTLPGNSYPYPQPGETSPAPYPGLPTEETYPAPYPGPIEQPTLTSPAQIKTPTSATPVSEAATPTTFLPEYQQTPIPGKFTTIRIWHSWSGQQLQMLEQAIQVYQSIEPDVSFDLLYVPFDELEGKFKAAAYNGEGPSLLLGDSDWGAQLSQNNLVKDLTPYISPEFIETLSPPALGTVQIDNRTVALPFAMRGVVLFRNKKLIPSASLTFDQFLEYSGLATQSGNVGLYLDLGCFFSCAQMQGLGGHWIDDQGRVLFDSDNYQAALGWLSQLQQIQESGALIEFNQDQAVNLFKLGKVGMIIDGSWRAWSLADAIGYENLVVDPWPSNGSGRMAGYVQADAVFLNSNTAERSLDEERAALRFMGLLMTPEVQLRLAEVGFIPAVIKTEPRDEMKAKLMAGLNTGIAFPPAWQGDVRQVYWASIDAAAQAVLERGVPAQQALETAATEIKERLKQIGMNK